MERRELRPGFATYRKWFVRNLIASVGLVVVLVALIAVQVGRADKSFTAIWIVGFFVAFLVVTIGWVIGTVATSRIVLEPGSVTYRRWGFMSTTFAIPGGIRGLLAGKTATGVPVRFLILRSSRERGKIKLNGGFWAEEDLAAIAAFAGVENSYDTLSPKQWQARVPGSMRWASRHPVGLGLILGSGIAIAVVGGVTLSFVASDTPPFDRQPAESILATEQQRQDALLDALTTDIGGVAAAPQRSTETCTDDLNYKGWELHTRVRIRTSTPAGESISKDQIAALDRTLGNAEWSPLEEGFTPGVESSPADPDVGGRVIVDTIDGEYELTFDGDCVTPHRSATSAQ